MTTQPIRARSGARAFTLTSAVAAATLLLSACSGGAGGAGGASGAGGGAKKNVSVGLVLGLTANAFMQEVVIGSKDAANATGAKLTVTGPAAPNPTEGLGMLSRVVSQGVDGVTIMPLPASLWSKGVKDAAAATKVNTINTLPVQGIKGAETYIGINDTVASTEMLNSLFAGKAASTTGEVVLGSCIPGVSALDTRTKTYKEYLAKHLPGVKVVGPITTTTDPAKNLSAWKQAYFAHSKALAFVGNCNSDGPSLARMHADNPGDYKTATFDIDNPTLTGIKNGQLTMAVDEAPYARGYIATAALIRQAQGKAPITGFVNVKGTLVTKSNVDEIIKREASPASIKAGFAPSVKAFLDDPKGATGPIVLEPIAKAYEGATV